MKIERKEINVASKENAEKYVDRVKNVAENAFAEGAEWVLNLIDKKMREI